jgi:hypothetical protein
VCWTLNHLPNPFLQDDGPALELTPELEKAREEFRINQLLPAMAPLLDSEKEPWSTWVDRLNLIGPVPEEEVTQVSNVGQALRCSLSKFHTFCVPIPFPQSVPQPISPIKLLQQRTQLLRNLSVNFQVSSTNLIFPLAVVF